MRALLFAVVVSLSACAPYNGPGQGGACTGDADCSGGELCTRTEVCLPPEQIQSIRVSWTFNGQSPTLADPAPCTGVDHLEVDLSGPSEYLGYAPVVCEQGSALYDRMPRGFDTVSVTTFDASGQTIASRSTPISGDSQVAVTLDLAP